LTVWVDNTLKQGYVAKDRYGMTVLGLSDLSHPSADTELLAMGDGSGISVRNGIACVASLGGTGLTLLDVSDPANIRELANLDTAGGAPFSGAVINCESLAYIGWAAGSSKELLRVVDISDPQMPHFVGGGTGFNPVEAMAISDTFIYCAEIARLEVFGVADPRHPVWAGMCGLSSDPCAITVVDTLAYVAPDIQIINVADPNHPSPVSTTPCNCWDIAPSDTFAFVAHAYESLKVYTVANPYAPSRLASVWVPGQAYAVVLQDSFAYLGCSDFRVFDIRSPASPALAGRYSTPYIVRGLDSDEKYIYAASSMAGVEMLQLLPAGISEPRGKLGCPARVAVGPSPNPARDLVKLSWNGSKAPPSVQVLDLSGRVVSRRKTSRAPDGTFSVELGGLEPGVYFLRCRSGQTEKLLRFVKT